MIKEKETMNQYKLGNGLELEMFTAKNINQKLVKHILIIIMIWSLSSSEEMSCYTILVLAYINKFNSFNDWLIYGWILMVCQPVKGYITSIPIYYQYFVQLFGFKYSYLILIIYTQ